MTPPDALPDPAELASDPPLHGASVEDLAPRFRERLRLFAARRLGGVDAAEDVAQETLRCVTEAVRAGRLREADALPGFVFQTAHHLCLQHHRSADREARTLLRLAAAEGQSPAPDALDGLIADERRQAVRRALDRMRNEDRELLRLVYFQEVEPDAIALAWGITPGALRVRKHRALQRLGQLVHEADP
jgi:RNA polymerase sigma factor (sigma-70 family)